MNTLRTFFIFPHQLHRLTMEQLLKRKHLNFAILGGLIALLSVTGIDRYIRLGALPDSYFIVLLTFIPVIAELGMIGKHLKAKV